MSEGRGPRRPRGLWAGRGKRTGKHGGGNAWPDPSAGVTWRLKKGEKDPASGHWHLEVGLGMVTRPSGEGGPGARGRRKSGRWGDSRGGGGLHPSASAAETGSRDSPCMLYSKDGKLEASCSRSPVTGRPRWSGRERGPGEVYLIWCGIDSRLFPDSSSLLLAPPNGAGKHPQSHRLTSLSVTNSAKGPSER